MSVVVIFVPCTLGLLYFYLMISKKNVFRRSTCWCIRWRILPTEDLRMDWLETVPLVTSHVTIYTVSNNSISTILKEMSYINNTFCNSLILNRWFFCHQDSFEINQYQNINILRNKDLDSFINLWLLSEAYIFWLYIIYMCDYAILIL